MYETPYNLAPEFYWAAFALVLVVSAGRITRLLVGDKFPPIVAVRDRFLDWTEKRPSTIGYGLLAICAYCMGFWVVLALMVWADLVGMFDGHPVWGGDGEVARGIWWAFNATFAGAYLASMTVARDGDKEPA